MSLLAVERIGSQEPRLCHLPPNQASREAGDEAIAVAELAGLILDPWQQWVIREALAETPELFWAAFEVALLCPRQNGKGGILEALELAALFVFDMRLVVHSAHLFGTAQEHFLRMKALVENSDVLMEKVEAIPTANGKEAIVLKNGNRLRFVARSRGAIRGFTGDLLVLDEAFALPEQAVGAMLPALSAVPNPQVWYTSSAPHHDSHVLHRLRKRAMRGDAGRLFFAEWSVEPGTLIDDRDGWYQANPALGIRISEQFIEDELEALRYLGDEFERERLGLASEEDDSSGTFPPGAWAACMDANSSMPGDVSIALDVAPDQAWSSFGAAGLRADGMLHVELIDRHPGTGWAVERAGELAQRWGVPIVVDSRSPAAGLMADLENAGVAVFEMPDGAAPRACAALQAKVLNGRLRHLGQLPLDDAVAGAATRTMGDAWKWARISSRVDISPLVAVTNAAWHADTPADAPKESGYLSLAEV